MNEEKHIDNKVFLIRLNYLINIFAEKSKEFLNKYDYYLSENFPKKEAYIKARWSAGLKKDFILEKTDKIVWEKEAELFDSLSYEEKIEKGLIEVYENEMPKL